MSTHSEERTRQGAVTARPSQTLCYGLGTLLVSGQPGVCPVGALTQKGKSSGLAARAELWRGIQAGQEVAS